jgi:trigger factor
MILERISSDGASVEYKVVFDTKEIEKRVDMAIAERRKTFKVSGYRIGHAPDHIVRSRFEGNVVQDVLQSLISEAGGKVVSESKMPALAVGPAYRLVDGGYKKGKDVEVIFTLEAAPEFELLPIELEVKKIIPEITDEEVVEERDRIIRLTPDFEKAENGHKIQPGDAVSYKAVCYNNGVESKRRSVTSSLIIQEDAADAAELNNGFIGKQVGDSFEFVPVNSRNVKYRIVIESVSLPKQLGPEEFAKKRGFKSLQELDNIVRVALWKDADAAAFSVHKNQILEEISKGYDFDVPERMYRHELRNVIGEVRRGSYEDTEGKSDEELEKEYAEVAKTRVVLGYVLSKMAHEFGIRVSDEELRAAVSVEIQKDPANAERILSYYRNNRQAIEYKKAEVLEAKIILHLLSKAKTEDLKMSGKETLKFVEEFFEDEDEDEATGS